MIRLIASDLDGTLLQNGAQKLTPRATELIGKLLEQGRIFVAASGRQYPNLQRLFAPLQDQIGYICENGSLVIYQNQILAKYEIPRETGRKILRAMMEREGCEPLLSGVHTCYIQPKTPEYAYHMKEIVKNNVTVVEDILKTEEPYLKISVYERAGIAHSQEYWKECFGDEVTVVTSGMAWLDTVPAGVNKGAALQEIQKKLKIPPEETLAFGDHYNDVEMLREAGYGFAMKNAQPGIRDLCRYETSCVEDTLEEILGGKYD